MNRWIPRVALILLASGLVATMLPGIKQRRGSDVESIPAQAIAWFQTPDSGSLTVAAFVALAILRLFVTLDRRARAQRTSEMSR